MSEPAKAIVGDIANVLVYAQEQILLNRIDAAIDAAVAAERERCAKIAESAGCAYSSMKPTCGDDVATVIRHQPNAQRSQE